MTVDTLHAPFVLHECAEADCARLALGTHCERHETVDDRERMEALDLASLKLAQAEECWRDARLLVIAAEDAAGVRRAATKPRLSR